MSRDFIENTEDTSHAEQLSKEHHTLILSDYAKNLEKSVKSRYLEKISVVRIDPATLIGANLDPECLPPIEPTNLSQLSSSASSPCLSTIEGILKNPIAMSFLLLLEQPTIT